MQAVPDATRADDRERVSEAGRTGRPVLAVARRRERGRSRAASLPSDRRRDPARTGTARLAGGAPRAEAQGGHARARPGGVPRRPSDAARVAGSASSTMGARPDHAPASLTAFMGVRRLPGWGGCSRSRHRDVQMPCRSHLSPSMRTAYHRRRRSGQEGVDQPQYGLDRDGAACKREPAAQASGGHACCRVGMESGTLLERASCRLFSATRSGSCRPRRGPA